MESFSKSANRTRRRRRKRLHCRRRLAAPLPSHPLLLRLHRTIYPLSSLLISPLPNVSLQQKRRGKTLFSRYCSPLVLAFHLPSLKFSSAVVATFPALPPSCHKARICGFHYCTETEACFYGGKMAAVEAMVCGISRGMRKEAKKSILQMRCFPLLHIVLCTRRHRRRRQTRRGEGRGKSRLVCWNVF